MKHTFYSIIFLLFFFVILLFPSETVIGATSGLLLWFQLLVPTLLPYLIITNLLIYTNAISFIVRLFGPIFQKIFLISAPASFAVISGLFCGYPVGAKVTAELVRQNKITIQEGNYLLSFCNNSSPAFISGYIMIKHFHDSSLIVPSLIILYSSFILCSFIFRFYYKPNLVKEKTMIFDLKFQYNMLDESIMNAFETITKIGGYIILFSILFQLGKNTVFHQFLPLLELTTGIPYILSQNITFCESYISVMGLTAFGGLCSIAQTNSVIQGSSLSIVFYIIEKLITAMVTSLLTFLYVMIILR